MRTAFTQHLVFSKDWGCSQTNCGDAYHSSGSNGEGGRGIWRENVVAIASRVVRMLAAGDVIE